MQGAGHDLSLKTACYVMVQSCTAHCLSCVWLLATGATAFARRVGDIRRTGTEMVPGKCSTRVTEPTHTHTHTVAPVWCRPAPLRRAGSTIGRRAQNRGDIHTHIHIHRAQPHATHTQGHQWDAGSLLMLRNVLAVRLRSEHRSTYRLRTGSDDCVCVCVCACVCACVCVCACRFCLTGQTVRST